MTNEYEQFYTELIDQRLERLHRARLRGDDVARGWHKLILGALVALRRAARLDSSI